MNILKFLLHSKTIEIFRGYLRSIFIENEANFFNQSTTICIYKQTFDKLSHHLKDLVLFVLDEEVNNIKNESLRQNIEVVEVSVKDIIADNFISNKIQTLPLENLLNNKFDELMTNCKKEINKFIIFELPMCFRESVSIFEDGNGDEDDIFDNVGVENICGITRHIGICNTTIEDASNTLEQSIYRVFSRFIERIKIQKENNNKHFILISPFFKPPKYIVGKGMIEIYLPIEWESDKFNLIKVVKEIFEGTEINNDAIEMIVASVSNQDTIFSNLIELCFEIKHSIISKHIGRRLLKNKKLNLKDIIEIKLEDVEEFIKSFNTRKLISNTSIDSLISTKISIDDDFIGLVELRNSIKRTIKSLETSIDSFNYFDKKQELEMFGYPVTWFLWGGSGSGKSTLVRSIVSLSPKVRVIFCNIIEIISPFQGITTRNLRKIFKISLNSRPCVLIFDDIEYLLGVYSLNNDFEEDIRSRIHRELMSTFLYLLDSIIFNEGNKEPSIIEIPQIFDENNEDNLDFINRNVFRKVSGFMIIMTSKVNFNALPKELMSKIQKHSILRFPTMEEFSEYYGKIKNEKIMESAKQIIDELNKNNSNRFLNASEFQLLIQENIYNKYGEVVKI